MSTKQPFQGRRALITGITGQDGYYLSALLLDKGYEVYGIMRPSTFANNDKHGAACGGHVPVACHCHYADMSDIHGLSAVIHLVRPHEIYNLAAQSHVGISFVQPICTSDITGLGALRLLEAVRNYQQQTGEEVRVYQASSSEIFGNPVVFPQDEKTPFNPCSPYATAKAFAHWTARNYRDSYGLLVSCGILFNHESPRRGESFVTRKITRAVGRIKCGLQRKVGLGNLQARRDWGFAGDYVEAMWRMLQVAPDDYVVATGISHSVRDMCEMAFAYAGMDYRDYIEIDAAYNRPADIGSLIGNPSKARCDLEWKPTIDFQSMIHQMVDHDIQLAMLEQRNEMAGNPVSDG